MDEITSGQAWRMVSHMRGLLVEHLLRCDVCEQEDMTCEEQQRLARLKQCWEDRVEQLWPASWEANVLRRLRGDIS